MVRRSRRGPSTSTDPIERDIEAAFDPGEYIAWREMPRFIRELELVAGKIAELVTASDAERGVRLYETFIAGCHLKAGEVDDSHGHFSGVITHLVSDWIRARQATHADPTDTARTLYAWHDRDECGYFSWIERMSVDALDPMGLTAFAGVARERYQAARSAPPSGNKSRHSRTVGAAADGLRTILAAADDMDAYEELCKETTTTAKDCLVLAGMCRRRSQTAEALAWVDKGLAEVEARRDYDMAEHELSILRLELLRALGRADEAFGAAWLRFEKAPSGSTYAKLMEYVADAGKPAWKEKAFDHADRASLDGLIDLCSATGEWARLAARLQRTTDAELSRLFYGTMVPAAKGMVAEHPQAAARLYVVLADQILNAAKAKAYHHALDYLAAARECLVRAGDGKAWDALVARLRTQHRLKSSFVPGLERIVAGELPQMRPSFLDEARSRWRTG